MAKTNIVADTKTFDGYDYTLTILGSPKSQGRHRTYTKGRDGRPLPYAVRVNPSAKDKKNLKLIVQERAPEKPLDCPLKLKVLFYFPYRKSDYGTGKNKGRLKGSAPVWHTVRPDCDNCVKLILDAFSGIFWRDDTLISMLEVQKKYSERPRTEIYIKLLIETKN